MSQQRFFIPEVMAKRKQRKKDVILGLIIMAVVLLSALITILANQI